MNYEDNSVLRGQKCHYKMKSKIMRKFFDEPVDALDHGLRAVASARFKPLGASGATLGAVGRAVARIRLDALRSDVELPGRVWCGTSP